MMTQSSSGAESEDHGADWVPAHEALSRLARDRAAADAEEGRCLLAALRAAAHVHLGYGSFGEYVEWLFGYKPRSTQEKLRVAAALEELPAIAQALEHGSLNWSAVRELTRVAVAETEQEWLQVAQGKNVQQLEALVSGKNPGDLPSSPGKSEARRHVLRFEVAADTLCIFREAMKKLRQRSGGSLDDDSTLVLMARHVLGGPTDDGRAPYQIELSVCPDCGQGLQQASGELIPVGSEVVAAAECDGQYLPGCGSQREGAAHEERESESSRGAHSAKQDSAKQDSAKECVHTGAPVVERTQGALCDAACAHMGAQEDSIRDRGAGITTTKQAAGVGDQRGEGAGTAHHSGEIAPRQRAHAGACADHRRARQRIAPSRRRQVLRRDHRRCTVPGCSNTLFLDVHHIQLSSEAGASVPDNLTTLCGAHHLAAHRGKLIISGAVSSGVRFTHADGSDYGRAVQPRALEVQTKVFAALRGLGFREGQARRALAEASSALGTETDAKCLLRQALARLGAKPGAGR